MITILARGPAEAEIRVDGAIGENWYGDGLTSKTFAQKLADIGPVQKISVKINSPGGSVPDGIAIYNQLRSHGARVEVYIEGQALSIASIIAMAGDHICMSTGAMMMIHSPWTFAMGNAEEMREIADVLDKHEQSLLDVYAKRTGYDRAKIEKLLAAETWLTGSEAHELGFCDQWEEPTEQEDTAQTAAATAKQRESFYAFAEEFRRNTAALTPHQIAAALKSAVAEATQEIEVTKPQASSATIADPTTTTTTAVVPPPVVAAAGSEQLRAAVALELRAAEATRRKSIVDAFGRHAAGHAKLLASCVDNMDCTLEQARQALLDAMGAQHTPLAPQPQTLAGIQPVQRGDEHDKYIAAATQAILARAGQKTRDKESGKEVYPVVDAGNPFRGHSLYDLAEHSVRRMGLHTAGMNRSQIVAIAFRGPIQAAQFGHTTSDFPNLLENVMHKMLLVAYWGAMTTWQRIARTGTLTDFRAHPRYRFGTFSDIKEVNQAGNYEQGTISDAEKETITAVRKGRILVVSRELIVNDDLQALADAARGLGRAANRTIDKDLYALLALNSNTGPTMGDGVVLFHSTHKNIATANGVPTVTNVDLARVQMAKQTDPSNNDFVDIRPNIAWCPLSLGSTFRVLNDSQYDPDAANKLQRPNVVKGLVSDVVDTPRLDAQSAIVWYLLANPNEEPVFEVGFIGGATEPRVEQMQEFTSDSLNWKVVHEYGVAAIGWRGIIKNAGV